MLFLIGYLQIFAFFSQRLTNSDIFRLEWKTNLFQDVKSQEHDSPIMVSEQASGQVSEQASEQALQIITFN